MHRCHHRSQQWIYTVKCLRSRGEWLSLSVFVTLGPQNEKQPPAVQRKRFSSAVLCLGVLCFLMLTAVIILSTCCKKKYIPQEMHSEKVEHFLHVYEPLWYLILKLFVTMITPPVCSACKEILLQYMENIFFLCKNALTTLQTFQNMCIKHLQYFDFFWYW